MNVNIVAALQVYIEESHWIWQKGEVEKIMKLFDKLKRHVNVYVNTNSTYVNSICYEINWIWCT